MIVTGEGRGTGHKNLPVSLCPPHIQPHGLT